MIKRHLHLWISIFSAVLISIFAEYTHYDVSYLLRMLGYTLAQYFSIHVAFRIGHETFYLSVVNVLIYSLMIYLVIYFITRGRKSGHHQYGPSNRQVLHGIN